MTRSVQCYDCLKCPPGQGLSARCGEVISTKTPVGCKQCVLGETYSSAHEAGACKDCKNCSPYRETIKACTLTSEAVCGSCKIGTYKEPVLGMCSPCSPCCNDSKDIFVPECQVPGVPINMHCSILRATKCSKISGTSVGAIKTLPPTQNKFIIHHSSFRTNAGTAGHDQPLSRVILITLVVCGFLLTMIWVVLCKTCRKDRTYMRLFKDERKEVCNVGIDQSCDFEMDSCISCQEKLKLIPEGRSPVT